MESDGKLSPRDIPLAAVTETKLMDGSVVTAKIPEVP